MNKTTNRLIYIDRLRGFAICFVVIGHIFSLVSATKPEMNLGSAISFLSIFELVIFFVISGYLFSKHHENSFTGFLKKKSKRLLIPYLVFSVLNILFFVFLEPVEGMTFFGMATDTLTFYGISVLWFFPALFFGEFLWWIVYKKFRLYGSLIALVAFILMAISLPYLQLTEGTVWLSSPVLGIVGKLLIVLARSIICMFFICTGHLFGLLEERFSSKKAWKPAMWLTLALGLLLTRYVPMINLKGLLLDSIWIWCICATAISVGLLFLCAQTASLPLNIMDVIGKNSMLIMCTHLDFKVPIYCMMLAEYFVSISPRAKNYIYWGTLFAALVLIEGILIVVWNLVKKKG